MKSVSPSSLFLFVLLFFQLLQTVNAAELSLASQDNLQLNQCEQGEFIFALSNPDETTASFSFTVTGLRNVDYSPLPAVTLAGGQSKQIRLTIWPKCGDAAAVGKHSFYLTATSASSSVHASASFAVAPVRTLSASLVALDSPAACACQPADYRLELRNNGQLATSGSIIASSPFKVNMPQEGFQLQPGEVLYRDVVVDVLCNATSTALLTVSIIPQDPNSGSLVKTLHAPISVQTCRGASISGLRSIEMCMGETLFLSYSLQNNGSTSDFVQLSSSRGLVSPSSLSLPPHSQRSFTVQLQPFQFTTRGKYSLTVLARGNTGTANATTEINAAFCRNRGVSMLIAVLNSVSNGTRVEIPVNPDGSAELVMFNPNSFELTNVLVVQNTQPISELFNLLPNTNKTVPIKLNLSRDFTNGTITLVFQSDAGVSAQELKFAKRPSLLSGLFTAISDPLVAGSIVIALLALVAYGYVRIRQVETLKARQEVHTHLQNYLDK